MSGELLVVEAAQATVLAGAVPLAAGTKIAQSGQGRVFGAGHGSGGGLSAPWRARERRAAGEDVARGHTQKRPGAWRRDGVRG